MSNEPDSTQNRPPEQSEADARSQQVRQRLREALTGPAAALALAHWLRWEEARRA